MLSLALLFHGQFGISCCMYFLKRKFAHLKKTIYQFEINMLMENLNMTVGKEWKIP